MQLKPENLAAKLAGSLAPIYLVAGDETLLVEEACDAILSAARRQGYSERRVMHVEPGFNWGELAGEAASQSLFAERRIIDLRPPANKFDRKASEALRAYAAKPPKDVLLLIRTGRLDGRQRSSAWFKTIDKAGAAVLVWPVGVRELPQWLAARLRSAGLQLDREAFAYLRERVEGNLLAAVQEIGKIKLLDLPQPIDAAAVAAAVEDVSHYDAFELIDAAFAGDAKRVRRVLRTLREEGVAVMAVLSAFASQLRRVESGAWMPSHRRSLAARFQRRAGGVETVLAELALIDQQVKGVVFGDPWLSLERLLLRHCGVGVPRFEDEWRYLQRSDL